MKSYAGIGSRETPASILSIMELYASVLFTKHYYLLRSGGASGADSAFEKGCDSVGGSKEIYRARDATADAIELASEFHPAWGLCNKFAQALHGRNMMIVLGADLKTSVDFIVCWTPDGKISGGTGQALRLAIARGIKVYNLFEQADMEEFNQKYMFLH